MAGSEPLLTYYSADFSVSHFLKFATSKFKVANFKIHSPKISSLLQRSLQQNMPQAQSINSIPQNNSFIVIAAQGNFNHILCENVMISTPEKALFSRLTFPSPQTFQKVFMPQTFIFHRFCQSFGFLFFPTFCQERIKFWPQPNPLSQKFFRRSHLSSAQSFSCFFSRLATLPKQQGDLWHNHLCQTIQPHLQKYPGKNHRFQ